MKPVCAYLFQSYFHWVRLILKLLSVLRTFRTFSGAGCDADVIVALFVCDLFSVVLPYLYNLSFSPSLSDLPC